MSTDTTAQESGGRQGEQGNETMVSEANTFLHVFPITHESHIIDLYAVGTKSDEQGNDQRTKLFIHQVQLLGPQGKMMDVWRLFDEGAMREAMSTTMFHRVKHRLGWSLP